MGAITTASGAVSSVGRIAQTDGISVGAKIAIIVICVALALLIAGYIVARSRRSDKKADEERSIAADEWVQMRLQGHLQTEMERVQAEAQGRSQRGYDGLRVELEAGGRDSVSAGRRSRRSSVGSLGDSLSDLKKHHERSRPEGEKVSLLADGERERDGSGLAVPEPTADVRSSREKPM